MSSIWRTSFATATSHHAGFGHRLSAFEHVLPCFGLRTPRPAPIQDSNFDASQLTSHSTTIHLGGNAQIADVDDYWNRRSPLQPTPPLQVRTHARSAAVLLSMHKHIPVLLLGLVLTALVCDITLHSHAVHAQVPLTVYIESAPHHFKERHDTLALKGTEVIGFQCADGSCFVLSK